MKALRVRGDAGSSALIRALARQGVSHRNARAGDTYDAYDAYDSMMRMARNDAHVYDAQCCASTYSCRFFTKLYSASTTLLKKVFSPTRYAILQDAPPVTQGSSHHTHAQHSQQDKASNGTFRFPKLFSPPSFLPLLSLLLLSSFLLFLPLLPSFFPLSSPFLPLPPFLPSNFPLPSNLRFL